MQDDAELNESLWRRVTAIYTPKDEPDYWMRCRDSYEAIADPALKEAARNRILSLGGFAQVHITSDNLINVSGVTIGRTPIRADGSNPLFFAENEDW